MTGTIQPHEARTIEELVGVWNTGVVPELICFWGHTELEPGVVGKECLSQWVPSPFTDPATSLTFKTAEHWMMAMKAALFNDQESFNRIMDCETPHEAKALGRKVKNFDEQLWTEESYKVVVQGNLLKFGQNKNMGQYLRLTGDRVLVEASPYDRIWGVGMRASDVTYHHPQDWKGMNKLGFALMEVRATLFPDLYGGSPR